MVVEHITLSYWHVAFAAILILINAGISIALRLGLAKSLIVAALRMVVQLSLIGFILKWVFSADYWLYVMLLLMVMTAIAGFSAKGRGKFNYQGIGIDALLSVWVSTWIIGAIGMELILHVQPWYSPQYLISIAGMMLGNTLTGVGLGLSRVTSELYQRRAKIETLQSMGATDWEAYKGVAKIALSAGMLPIINQMSVMGLVSLPGMMTGQILAGQDPYQAILYQIVAMFILGASTGAGCLLSILLVYRRLFSKNHIFKFEALKKKK